jgi:hypothetical protein
MAGFLRFESAKGGRKAQHPYYLYRLKVLDKVENQHNIKVPTLPRHSQ